MKKYFNDPSPENKFSYPNIEATFMIWVMQKTILLILLMVKQVYFKNKININNIKLL